MNKIKLSISISIDEDLVEKIDIARSDPDNHTYKNRSRSNVIETILATALSDVEIPED